MMKLSTKWVRRIVAFAIGIGIAVLLACCLEF